MLGCRVDDNPCQPVNLPTNILVKELRSYGVKELWSYGVKELSQMP